MKVVINCILALCVLGLAWLCYGSIMGPINFENAKKERELAIKESLINIRTAQEQYRNILKGAYCTDLDSLAAFVATAQLPIVKKEGELTDDQLENGMTESKAVAMIEKARKTNKWNEVEKAGLMGFSRDTIFVSLKDSLFGKDYDPATLAYVPFGNGAKFELNTSVDSTRSGTPLYLFEAQVPYEIYLSDLDKQEVINQRDYDEKTGRYPGMKVGDDEEPHNNAGNWE